MRDKLSAQRRNMPKHKNGCNLKHRNMEGGKLVLPFNNSTTYVICTLKITYIIFQKNWFSMSLHCVWYQFLVLIIDLI